MHMKVFGLAAIMVLAMLASLHAQNKQKVMVMEIKEEIDPRMFRYVKLALEHAESTRADIVMLKWTPTAASSQTPKRLST